MTDSLDDTVDLLGDAGVVLLSTKPPHVQKLVVGSVLKCIQYWESCGITLDPVQREVVLDSLIATFLPYAELLEESIATAHSATARLADQTGQGDPGVHGDEGFSGESPNGISTGRGSRLLLFLLSFARGNSRTRG